MKKSFGRFPDATEFSFLIFVFLIALYFFVTALGFDAEGRQFPLLTSGLTLVLTAVYAARLYVAGGKPAATTPFENDDGEAGTETSPASRVKFFTTLVCFVGYIIITYLFGFLVASAVIGLAYPIIHGYRKPIGVILSFVVNVGIVLSFQSFLGVPLSRGLLLDMTRLFY